MTSTSTMEERAQREHCPSETPPPHIGTTLPFIWPPPQHLQSPPPFKEPVLPFPPPESLLAKEIKLDAIRCEEPSNHQGKQVYDSLNRPPQRAGRGDGVDYANARGATRDEDMPRWYSLTGDDDDTVLFESRFESGNLRSAERMCERTPTREYRTNQCNESGDSEYNLQLAFDINTDRHTQWFYFRMTNLRRGRPYKLNMQNLMKTEAVYNLGMQPLAYSEVRAAQEGVGWYRTGSDACYFKNQLVRGGLKPFWTLTFTVQTSYDQDTLYLAHCFPYRYTDLQEYLKDLEASPLGQSFVIRRRSLCETLAGNVCDLLTITSPGGDHASKKGIVISARVHPGETNASWMMKGVLDYLSSDSHSAQALRDKFVFKIVPMLNPDGVIVGNYRCSLAGGDLNRQYEEPKRELFPEVLHLKQMISNFGIGKEVLLYVDLHGHSKKSNIFMYGVENPTDEDLYMRERVIPSLLDQASPLFNLLDCTFDIGKGKEGCGRVVVRRQLGIVNAYTMEASFMGADQGEFQGLHFHQGHYESMGHSLCEVLLDLVDPDQTKVGGIVRKLKEKFPIDRSRVVSKRCDDSSRHGDSSSSNNSGASSDDSEAVRHVDRRQRHHRQLASSPSKPSTPTARDTGTDPGTSKGNGNGNGKPRPGARPASARSIGKKGNADREKGTGRRGVEGNSGGGGGVGSSGGGVGRGVDTKEEKTGTPRSGRQNERNSSPSGTREAKAPPGNAPHSPRAKSGSLSANAAPRKLNPSPPTSPKGTSPKAATAKGVSAKVGKSLTTKTAPSKGAVVEGAAKAKDISAKAASNKISSGDGSGGPKDSGKGKQKSKGDKALSASGSPAVAQKAITRKESVKLAPAGSCKKTASGGSGMGGAKGSKLLTVAPRKSLGRRRSAPSNTAVASSTATTTNGRKVSKKGMGNSTSSRSSSAGTKVGRPAAAAVAAVAPAKRPASSPASRSTSSPRHRAGVAAVDSAPQRSPSAPPKTRPRRAEAGSTEGIGKAEGGGKVRGAAAAGGGGGGSGGGRKSTPGGPGSSSSRRDRGGKGEALPLPPLRPKPLSSSKM